MYMYANIACYLYHNQNNSDSANGLGKSYEKISENHPVRSIYRLRLDKVDWWDDSFCVVKNLYRIRSKKKNTKKIILKNI